jgi:preprotein translocase subunit SecF
MQLFNKETTFDFMGKRKLAILFSLVMIVIGISSFFINGFNLGIDFTGGTVIEVVYEKPAELPQIRNQLSSGGFGDAIVQHFGTTRDILIRIAPHSDISSTEVSNRILEILRKNTSDVEMRRVEFVGPQVGEELTEQGSLAMLYALAGILIYVWLRFEWQFAVGSVIALVHDVIITIGLFSLFKWEFDLTVMAAVLAVIGYSLNDTIVVFDRIRENFRRMRTSDNVKIINASLNQTLSRTLMTSVTTLLVLIALFALGGELIHGFAKALIVGVLVGTYSSIYIASNALISLNVSKTDLMPVQKEGAEFDDLP